MSLDFSLENFKAIGRTFFCTIDHINGNYNPENSGLNGETSAQLKQDLADFEFEDRLTNKNKLLVCCLCKNTENPDDTKKGAFLFTINNFWINTVYCYDYENQFNLCNAPTFKFKYGTRKIDLDNLECVIIEDEKEYSIDLDSIACILKDNIEDYHSDNAVTTIVNSTKKPIRFLNSKKVTGTTDDDHDYTFDGLDINNVYIRNSTVTYCTESSYMTGNEIYPFVLTQNFCGGRNFYINKENVLILNEAVVIGSVDTIAFDAYNGVISSETSSPYVSLLGFTFDYMKIENGKIPLGRLLYNGETDFYIYKRGKAGISYNVIYNYGKYPDVNKDDLVITDDVIPVYICPYEKVDSGFNCDTVRPVIIKLCKDAIFGSVGTSETVIVTDELIKDLSVKDDNKGYKDYISLNDDFYMYFTSTERLVDLRNCFYEISHHEDSVESFKYDGITTYNETESRVDIKQIRIDLPLLCLLKRPNLTIHDLNAEIKLDVNDNGKDNGKEGMYLYIYNNDYNPSPTIPIKQADSFHEPPIKSDDSWYQKVISTIIESDNYCISLHFTFTNRDPYFGIKNEKGYNVLSLCKRTNNSVVNYWLIWERNKKSGDTFASKTVFVNQISVGDNSVISVTDFDNKVIFEFEENKTRFIKGSSLEEDGIPCNCGINSSWLIEGINYNEYDNITTLFAIYKDTSKDIPQPFFNVFIGNLDINSSEYVSTTTEAVFNEYKTLVTSYISGREPGNSSTIPNSVNIKNVYLLIFICYRYRYQYSQTGNDARIVKHYYKCLLNYKNDTVPFIERIYLSGTKDSVTSSVFEFMANVEEGKQFIAVTNEGDCSILNLNGDIELNTTEPITVKNLKIVGNVNDGTELDDYLTNNGCNCYITVSSNTGEELKVPLDFLNKEGVSLKDIDVDSATFQCFVYDR